MYCSERICATIFAMYCVWEILRVAYLPDISLYIFILSGLFFYWNLFLFFTFKRHKSKSDNLFSGLRKFSLKKMPLLVHMVSLVIMFFIVVFYWLDPPFFMLTQIVMWGILLPNNSYKKSVYVKRLSLTFTMVYILFILLVSKNIFLGISTGVYMFSWAYLQITSDKQISESIIPSKQEETMRD